MNQRNKSIGGSDLPVITGISPYKTPFQLWQEKTGQVVAEDISLQPQIMQGQAFEDVARLELERKYGKTFKPSFIENGWMSGNLDGSSKDGKEIIEIKVTGKDKQEEARGGRIPLAHLQQVYWYLHLTGADICHYANYNPTTEEFIVIDVLPDAKIQSELLESAYKFWHFNVLEKNPPAYQKGDVVELKEPEFLAAAEQYKTLHGQKKTIEAQLKILEEIIESRLAEYPAIKGGGIRATRVTRQGNIVYKNVKELEGVDLEQYRAKESTYMRVMVENE